MSDRERTRAAAIAAVVAATLAIAGWLVSRGDGPLAALGAVLLVLGILGLVQAILIGLGVLPRSTRKRG